MNRNKLFKYLLKHGIKNAIAVNGTSVPETIVELSKEKSITAFVDGDRGGKLIVKELFAVADIDYVTFIGGLFSLDGKHKVTVEKRILIENCEGLGALCAQEILKEGGEEIMIKLKKELSL